MTRWTVMWMCISGLLALALAWSHQVGATVVLAVLGVLLPLLVINLFLAGDERMRLIAIGAALPSLLAFVFSAACFVILVFDADDIVRIDGAAIGLTLLVLAMPLCIAVVHAFGRASWITAFLRSGKTKSGQLSLAYLFGVMTVLTIALAVVFGLPEEIGTALLMFLGLVVSVIALVGILCYESEIRLFWIGAAIPAALLFIATCTLYVAATFEGWDRMLRLQNVPAGIRAGSILVWLLMPVMGMLATYCYRLLANRKSSRVDPTETNPADRELTDDEL